MGDVVQALLLALRTSGGRAYNIGSGQATVILDVARLMCGSVGLTPHVSGAARVGDIRHCTADNSAAASAFGYKPQTEFAVGLATLGAEIHESGPADLLTARRELAQAGLLR